MKWVGCAPRWMTLGVLFCIASSGAPSAEDALATGSLAWRREDGYMAPDSARYFPDSPEGAAALAEFWSAPKRDDLDSALTLITVRQGLRRYEGDRAAILRWLGGRCIVGVTSTDDEAVELLYHALDINPVEAGGIEARRAALRFGVSRLRPIPPNVLRALAALSIATEDSEELGRIVWAIGEERERALAALDEYARTTDGVDQAKVDVVKRLWRRELKVSDWVRQRQRDAAGAEFGEQLPAMIARWTSGTSDERRETLALVVRENLVALLPERALNGLAECADDHDSEVRALTARLIGERWVLGVDYLHPRAVELLLKLSRDAAEPVRYNAVFYGLAVMPTKDDEIIQRLLEEAWRTSDRSLDEQILRGLRTCGPRAIALLDPWRTSARAGERSFARHVEGALRNPA